MSEMITVFTVQGMRCGSCALLIDDALCDVPGVIDSTTTVRGGRTEVRYDPTRCQPAVIVEVLTELGYQAETV